MQLEMNFQNGQSGKMSQVPSVAIKETTSQGSLTKWQTSGHWRLNGTSWMHNGSESPSAEGVSLCLLATILEPLQDVPSKYYLSPKTAKGILNRAGKRKRASEAIASILGKPSVYGKVGHGKWAEGGVSLTATDHKRPENNIVAEDPISFHAKQDPISSENVSQTLYGQNGIAVAVPGPIIVDGTRINDIRIYEDQITNIKTQNGYRWWASTFGGVGKSCIGL